MKKKTGEKAQLLVSTDYFIRNILNILSNRHRSKPPEQIVR